MPRAILHHRLFIGKVPFVPSVVNNKDNGETLRQRSPNHLETIRRFSFFFSIRGGIVVERQTPTKAFSLNALRLITDNRRRTPVEPRMFLR